MIEIGPNMKEAIEVIAIMAGASVFYWALFRQK